MSLLENRVAVVTGGGRGLGRAYALMLARHGAKVLINDLGASSAGAGADAMPAQQVAADIVAMGGVAAVNTSDVADWVAARQMIEQAVDIFGGVDILINNAGILRDRMLVNMTEDEWDQVIRVHLKGTFAPLHHAANYWRAHAKAGRTVEARIINTTSHSGLFGNIGQANYAAAKAGIASLTVVAARELQRSGVNVNAVAPRAHTRLTEGLGQPNEEQIALRNPDWIAALVTWLASTESRAISGRVFEAWGHGYAILEGWQHGPRTDALMDPAQLGPRIEQIAQHARANAGIDRGSSLDP
jgi:NAD(P)-dependent dehydrogenase (short-subunit alcohol dehydrogenase family)